MAFIGSKKVYAILANDKNGEGQKIIAKVAELTKEELIKELDEFFKNNGGVDNNYDFFKLKNGKYIAEQLHQRIMEKTTPENLKKIKASLVELLGSDEITMESVREWVKVKNENIIRIDMESKQASEINYKANPEFAKREFDKQLKERPKKFERIAYIYVGAPASGKSSLSKNNIENEGCFEVDADIQKEYNEEYMANTDKVSLVHDASSKEAKMMLDMVISKGGNVVIPKVGAKSESIGKLIKKLKDNNYKVVLGNVFVDKKERLQRNMYRALTTGRLISSRIIRESFGVEIDGTYEKYKNECDGYMKFDSGKGEYLEKGGNQK